MAVSGKNAPFKSNKTPPPKIETRSGGTSYGQANDDTPSSIPPGQAVISELGANLKSSVDDSALGTVMKRGAGRGDDVLNSQMRKIAPGNVPDAFGQKGASKGGTVPAKTGGSEAPLPSRAYAGPEK